jgi:PAS domain S-box-containing protein
MKMPAHRASRKRKTERAIPNAIPAAGNRTHLAGPWIRAVLQSSSQAILAVDRDGRIASASPAAERLYGYGAGEMLQLPLENLIPERYRERHSVHFKEWFSQPRARPMNIGVELSCLRKDGVEFAAEASLSYADRPEGGWVVAFLSDITERRERERMLADYRERIQKLTAGLIAAQESGNRELARELHDVVSQELARVGMEISTLKKAAGSLVRSLTELGERVSRLARDLHRSAREIHPAILEHLGLEAALLEECDAFQQRSGIPVRFKAATIPAMAPDVALCLYRVAQESLRNIAKHAAGTDAVTVTLTGEANGVTLRIRDTGGGFELDQALRKGGLGLISMEERVRSLNGELTIHSRPGSGTVVSASVPLGVGREKCAAQS